MLILRRLYEDMFPTLSGSKVDRYTGESPFCILQNKASLCFFLLVASVSHPVSLSKDSSYNTELNDLREIICLRKLYVSTV